MNKLDLPYPILDVACDNDVISVKVVAQETEVVYEKADACSNSVSEEKQTNGSHVDVELPNKPVEIPATLPTTDISLLTILRHRTLCLYLILSCLLWCVT